MRHRARLSILAAVLVTIVPPCVRADDQRGAEHDAQARFEEGLQRAKVGDFEAARVSFVQAYAVLHRPRILWNLALCEEKTGRVLDAMVHFRAVARDAAASDSDRADAQSHATALRDRIGLIEVRAPPGAVVTLDGNSQVGTTPLTEPIEVMPGRHVVEAKLPQGTVAAVVEATAGEIKQANFAAAESPTAAPPVTARLQEARPTATPSPSGDGSQPTSGQPTVAQAATARPTAAQPSSGQLASAQPSSAQSASYERNAPKGRLVVVAATGGAAVAAAAVGVYFAIKSQDDAHTVDGFRLQSLNPASACYMATTATCGAWNDAVEAQKRDAALSVALYVTGGVLAAAAVVTWFVWPKGSRGHVATWLLPVVPVGDIKGGIGFVF